MPARENHSTASRKYNGSRQIHQNRTRFNPLRHQPDKALPTSVHRQASSLCCRRCQLIIKWKLDYGKYPTLVQIRKALRCCGACGEKSVSIPFHHVCQDCSEELAICAKCRLTAEESEARAMDAIRKGHYDDEDAEYYAQLEAPSEDEDEEESGSDDDDDKKKDPHARKTRIHEDNGEAPEGEEEEFPELLRLKGLDVSLLRYNLEEAKKENALNAIKAQGRLRERDRRSAMRRLQQGDEEGALEIAKRAALGNNNEDDDEEIEEEDEVPTKEMTKDSELNLNKMVAQNNNKQQSLAAAIAQKPKLKLARDSKKKNDEANDTPSDEETL